MTGAQRRQIRSVEPQSIYLIRIRLGACRCEIPCKQHPEEYCGGGCQHRISPDGDSSACSRLLGGTSKSSGPNGLATTTQVYASRHCDSTEGVRQSQRPAFRNGYVLKHRIDLRKTLFAMPKWPARRLLFETAPGRPTIASVARRATFRRSHRRQGLVWKGATVRRAKQATLQRRLRRMRTATRESQ